MPIPMPSERPQSGVADAEPIAGSPVYPIGSRVNERGHLEIAGCDLLEVAAEFGTPAYVYAEDDMRARARAYSDALARHDPDFEVLFASKAMPCTATYRLFAEEGLSVDVASGGELTMALRAGFDPARIHMHGNNKSDEEILLAARSGVGHLILDSFDEIDRCEHLLDRRQDVLVRVTPGVSASTHDYVQTGQIDSKFGFGLADGLAAEAIARVLASELLNLVGLHAHIGSQILELEPYTLAIRALGELARRVVPPGQRRRRPRHRLRRPATSPPRSTPTPRSRWRGARGLRRRAADPGRARPLAGRQRRGHRLHRRHRQGDPRGANLRRRRRRHVRQPAADALRVPLRGGDRRPCRRRRPTPR